MRIATLASSSSGNAIWVEEEETAVLIDAGLSVRKLKEAAAQLERCLEQLAAVVVTHEHRDHTCGLGALSRKYNLPVYATESTWAAMEAQLGPIAEHNRCMLAPEEKIEIGELAFEAFSTSHDAGDPVGYVFHTREATAGVMTDTGYVSRGMARKLMECELLVFEANHDREMLIQGPYPWSLKKRILSDRGHLANDTAGDVLARLWGGRQQGVLLAHLSQENNTPRKALKTVEEHFQALGIKPGEEAWLEVAPASSPSTWLEKK